MALASKVYAWFLLIWLRCVTGRNLLLSCDFGIINNETLCGMEQGEDNVDDNFDWKLTSTSNKGDTGPSTDHTGNDEGTGRFLWADSNDGTPGQTASIATPPFNRTDGEGRLTFWYHIYGDGHLQLIVCQDKGPVLTLDGDQGNEWHQQNMTVLCEDNPVQITFMYIANSKISDVGIDDIYLYDHVLNTAYTSATTPVPATSNEAEPTVTGSYSNGSLPAGFTTMTTVEADESSTSISPLPITGLALPITLSIVAVFFVVALIILVCFIMKRRKQPEKPTSQGTVHKYNNHAYSTEVDDVRDNTTDTRRNTNSTFDSSTWRSEVSTMGGTGTNGILGGSQPRNRSSQASSGGSGSGAPGDTAEPETRHYFVLNPGRASMLVEDAGDDGKVQNRYDPVALYDNKPGRYTYIDNDGSSNTMATGDAVKDGMDANGYDPVTIKDDINGGYQVVDDTGATVVDGGIQNPYEAITVGERPSKSNKNKASERKTPTPAARKNVPPQPKDRIMVDNVLYKPMNGEQMVDNVLYNPIHDDK